MYILTLHCPDKPGIVAAVATSLNNAECNIENSAQFNDPLSGCFFMRVVFAPLSEGAKTRFQDNFQTTANRFSMTWNIVKTDQSVKALIMVSKDTHCLHDLLYRSQARGLNIDITGIVSNHKTCKPLAESSNIPFHHIPDNDENKLREIIETTNTQLIVLARYMQILSNQICNDYAGQIINIHHSFLPGFKGARPYHQAYQRGVKIIGATAHYATSNLDEGPIIEQETVRIDHTHTPEKLQILGRDIESRVLSRAVQRHTDHHVFLHDNRTVIL